MGERLTGFAFALIGVVYIISSMSVMYFLITIGGLLETLGSYTSAYGVNMPTFTTYFAAGWAFEILQLVTGFVALIAGIAILIKPKEKV